jgi:hypothetical protein
MSPPASRTTDQPDQGTGFLFVDGLDRAMDLARAAAGDQDVSVGGSKRLFEGFGHDLDLDPRKDKRALLAVRH